MNDDEFERHLTEAWTASAPRLVRERVLRAVHGELRKTASRSYWRAASIAALLLVSIGLNLICGAYDRQLSWDISGGPRQSRSILELKNDIGQAAPGVETDWVERYLQRFENL